MNFWCQQADLNLRPASGQEWQQTGQATMSSTLRSRCQPCMKQQQASQQQTLDCKVIFGYEGSMLAYLAYAKGLAL